MKARVVEVADLEKAGRWSAGFHVHGREGLFAEGYCLRELSDVVTLSVDAADPSSLGESFYYIGLENIEPVTGDLVGMEKVGNYAVRSRSKVFRQGDILYGRLRPNLRKALLVGGKYHWGLCSTELLVLKPNESVVSGVFLRELLVSKQLTNVICRLQSGAALPRVSAKDLLSVQVPIPPLQEQRKMAAAAEEIKAKRRSLRAKLRRLGEERENVLSRLFA